MIKGKIAQVLNEFRVVINKGRNDGVTYGQKFVIYSEGDLIKDPDSGKPLGRLEFPKARVRIVDVNEAYAIAESDSKYRTQPFGTLGISLVGVEQTQPLKIAKNLKTIEPDDTINVGDLVREVL